VISAIQDKGGGAHIFPRAKYSRRAQAQASRHIFQEGGASHHSAGTSFEGLLYKLEKKLGLYQVPCVFTCCSICFEISNIYLSLYWFSPWGFFQGHVDQKHLCTFVMVCLVLSAVLVVKDPRGYLMF
jgi:hypothetical protein